MSYFMSCQKCGKGMTVSHESDEPICSVCFFGFKNVDESSIEKLIEKATDKLSVEKLQEQLNTAKYFFKNILDVNPNLHGGNSVIHLKNCVNVMKISAEKALAEIGGDDGQ